MKAQEILNKIKEVVGIELSEEVSVKLEELKLDNGTILVAEKFESGETAFIKSEDDENIALPVGEYNLEDGRKLIVKEEGLIDSIGEAQEEEVEEEELEEDDKEEMEYVTKEEFASAVEEIKAMIEDKFSKEEVEEEVIEEEVKEELKEEVKEELSAEVAEPVVHNPEATQEKKVNIQISSLAAESTTERIYKRINNQ